MNRHKTSSPELRRTDVKSVHAVAIIKRHLACVICVFACLLVNPGTGHAQFDFGAYVGLNSTKLSGDSPKRFKYKAKMGPTVGAIINWYIKDDVRLSFQPGYAVSRPVFQYVDNDLGELRDSITAELDYLKLPIYLDVIADNDKWHFLAGLDAQILTKQSAYSDTEEFDFSDELTNLNLNIVFGLGYRIHLKKPILNIDLRFNQGVLNLSDMPDEETSLVPRIKTSTVELIVGFEFGNKKVAQ